MAHTVEVKEIDQFTREIIVRVPAEDIQSLVQKKLRDYSKSMQVPGFRRGKYPTSLILQRHGDAILEEVKREQVEAVVPDAIKEHDLKPFQTPEIIFDEKTALDAPLEYKAVFEVMPAFDLPDLSKVKLTQYEVPEITEEFFPKPLENLQRQFKTYEATTGKIKATDRLTVSVEAKIDGEKVEALCQEEAKLIMGQNALGPDIDQQIIGKTVKKRVSASATFPEGADEAIANKTVNFTLNLIEHEQEVPGELNEENIKKLGIESGKLEELKEKMKPVIEKEVKMTLKAENIEATKKALLKKVPAFDLSPTAVKNELKSLAEHQHDPAIAELDPSSDDPKVEKIRENLRLFFVLNRVNEDHQAQVEDADLIKFMQENTASPEMMMQQITWLQEDNRRIEMVRYQVLEQKIYAIIADTMDTQMKALSYADFVKLTEQETAS